MKKVRETLVKGKRLFIGIDVHKRTWVVTVRTRELELQTVTMGASWEALQNFLARYAGGSGL